MPTIVTWLLPVVLAALGRMLAGVFSGPCPATAVAAICDHWSTIATVAGAVLGLFGIGVHQTALAQARAVVRAQPANKPVSDPGSPGTNVPQDLARIAHSAPTDGEKPAPQHETGG